MKKRSLGRLSGIPKIDKVPAFLLPIAYVINGIADILAMNVPIAGSGVKISESEQGAVIKVDDQLMQLLTEYQNAKAGNTETQNPDGSTVTNIFNSTGNGTGTGLPDTGTDPEGNPTTPNGQTLHWQTRYVCVSDGEGGWTPMKEDYYGGDPYL